MAIRHFLAVFLSLLSFIPVAGATSYTFNATSGNVNVTTNWSPNGTPGIGDTVDIPAGKHAIIPTGYTWHVGTCPATLAISTTTPSIEIDTSGSSVGILEVKAGAVYEPCGSTLMTNGSDTVGGTPNSTLQLDTNSTLTFDQNNVAFPYQVFANNFYEGNQVLIGQPGDACGLTAASCPTQVNCINCGSATPDFTDLGNTTSMNYQVYGVGASNCGTSSVGCFSGSALSSTFNSTFTFENSVFDTTGGVQLTQVGDFAIVNLINNKFINSTASAIMGAAGSAGSSDTGMACIISGNYFDTQFGNGSIVLGCNYTYNVFGGSFQQGGTPNAGTYAGWNWNWVRKLTDCLVDANRFAWAAAVNDHTYISCDSNAGGGSAHITAVSGSTQTIGAVTIQNVIGQYIDDTNEGESHLILTPTQSVSASTLTIDMNNILSTVGTHTGETAGTLVVVGIGGLNPTQPSTSLEHNTVAGNAFVADTWMVVLGHSGSFPASTVITNYKYNLLVGTSTNVGNFGIGTPYINQNNAPNTMVASANVDYNGTYFSQSGSRYVLNYDANCSPSLTQGTSYDYCEAAHTPGIHDINNVNPGLLDSTRNLQKWASMNGQANSLTGALAVFKSAANTAFPSVFYSLFTYVKNGYMPTNPKFWNAGSDNLTLGTSQPVMFPGTGMMRTVVK